ncbi:hypothetical protein [Plastoroseomonas arctica]|nr:hypothetical protein [Plastoroseomonas arctica]
MTPEERPAFDRVAFDRRRKSRNWAILGVLVAIVVLFYFIAVARLTRG